MKTMITMLTVAATLSILPTSGAQASDQANGQQLGLAHVVSAMESDMASLLDELRIEAVAEPTSNGIPQRLDAIGANATYVVDTLSNDLDAALLLLGQQNGLAPSRIGVAAIPEDGISIATLFGIINEVAETQTTLLLLIKDAKESVSIGDMFAVQLLINKLGQLSERTATIISTANDAINSLCRNCRG
jgi:uncharacterized protein DUF5407